MRILFLALAAITCIVCDFASANSTENADVAINIAFEVKEAAGVGASEFPSHVVVPVAQGSLNNSDGLSVIDNTGSPVSAQFSVLNRWWAKDNSVRHMLVQFPATVDAYTTSGTGISQYSIVSGDNPAPADPVIVIDGNTISISNNAIEVSMTRSPFSIQTPNGALQALFTDRVGDTIPTFARNDLEIEIEEPGPVRAVVRVSAPTITREDGSLLHGWAMRLYAYAGQTHIKVDMQLQNAALDSVLSGPLYFDSFELRLGGERAGSTESRRAVLTDTPLINPPPGGLVNANTGIGIRQFYETWPNGVRRETDGTLVAELFPAWSENQMLANDDIYGEGLTASGSGLFWLDDMQAVVKEVVIDFAVPSQSAFENLLATVDYPPVAVLSLGHFRKTEATLDLGGYISNELERPSYDDAQRTPEYPLRSTNIRLAAFNNVFFLGWDEFLHSAIRKRAPNTAGDWPPQNAQFIVTGNPRDYFMAADRARGELNVKPAWLPGYQYDVDQTRLQLTENPYGGTSWRKISRGNEHLRFEYLPNTRQDSRPRDDEHGWFYHVAQSYEFTGDPWVRDWYEFVAEFRKVRLQQGDPFPNMSGRAVAHALNHALQAYRIVGDVELLDMLASYAQLQIEPRLNSVGAWTGLSETAVASWQTGYMLRTLIGILEEMPGGPPLSRHTPTANVIKRSVEWNMAIGNFSNWRSLSLTDPGASDGTGFTMVDPQLWYAQQTGNTAAVSHTKDFLDGGINGGRGPFGNFAGWSGSYEGRFTPITTISNVTACEIYEPAQRF